MISKMILDLIVNNLTSAKEKLVGADTVYLSHSKQLTDSLKKLEYNSKNRVVNFYDDKLFSTLNYRMKVADQKAKELEVKTDTLNDMIAEFQKDMDEGIKDLESMEDERIQSIIDSLNQMNVFQTN